MLPRDAAGAAAYALTPYIRLRAAMIMPRFRLLRPSHHHHQTPPLRASFSLRRYASIAEAHAIATR